MKKHRRNIQFIAIATVMVFSLMGCKYLEVATDEGLASDLAEVEIAIDEYDELFDDFELISLCKSEKIGVGFYIPEGWVCTVDNESPALIVDSELLYMEVRPYGRGYCEGDETCEIIDVVASDELSVFEVKSEWGSEVLGIINDVNGEWLSAIYNIQMNHSDMEELDQILEVFDSMETYSLTE